jgi:hypothetical protein
MAKCILRLRRGWKDDATGRNDWVTYEAKATHKKPLAGELVLEYDNGIPRLKIGDGIHEFSDLPYMSVDSFLLPKPALVHLGSNWIPDSDDRYYQVVTVQNATVTKNSKVDLLPDAIQLSVFHEKDLAFVAENEDGVVKVYCVGQVPTNEYDINTTVTEVSTNG